MYVHVATHVFLASAVLELEPVSRSTFLIVESNTLKTDEDRAKICGSARSANGFARCKFSRPVLNRPKTNGKPANERLLACGSPRCFSFEIRRVRVDQ